MNFLGVKNMDNFLIVVNDESECVEIFEYLNKIGLSPSSTPYDTDTSDREITCVRFCSDYNFYWASSLDINFDLQYNTYKVYNNLEEFKNRDVRCSVKCNKGFEIAVRNEVECIETVNFLTLLGFKLSSNSSDTLYTQHTKTIRFDRIENYFWPSALSINFDPSEYTSFDSLEDFKNNLVISFKRV
jgi:hypothetical protein